MTATKTMQADEKNWLLKSSTRILGPMTHAEIIDLLKKKQVSMIDEVRQPAVRWMTIRENRSFVEAIHEIQEMENLHEGSQGQITRTLNQTQTENIYEVENESDSTVVDTNLKDVQLTQEVSLQSHAQESVAKSFGAINDKRRIENASHKQKQLKIIIFSLILLVLVAFAGLQFFQKERDEQLYKQFVHSAIRYKSLNLYDQSISAYRKAKSLRKLDASTEQKMAPLAILFETEVTPLRSLLAQPSLANDQGHRKQYVENLVSIGLSYVRESDYQSAKEYFQKALTYDSSSQVATINLALMQFKQGLPSEGLKLLERISSSENYSAFLLYAQGLGLQALRAFKEQTDEAKLLSSEIDSRLRNSSQMQNHLRLIDLRLQLDEGARSNVENALQKYLQLEPGFSQDQVQYFQLDWSLLNSENLFKSCQEIHAKLPFGVLSQTFMAFCSIESGRLIEAKQFINEALSISPGHPYAVHVQAFLLSKMNMSAEAVALIKKNGAQLFPTTISLLGRLCLEQNDEACAIKSLNETKDRISARSQSQWGLARLAVKKDKSIEALNFIRTGLDSNSDYRPLIELRNQLESVD
jgi:tetratricopeptide (TPR) repeat protein